MKRTREIDRKRAYHSCGRKRRYRDHWEAQRAQRKAEAERGQPLRIYDCHLCKGYHLTSRDFIAG